MIEEELDNRQELGMVVNLLTEIACKKKSAKEKDKFWEKLYELIDGPEELDYIDVVPYMEDCITLTLIRAQDNDKNLPWFIDRENGIARLESIEIKVKNVDDRRFLPVSYQEIGKELKDMKFNKELFEDGLYAYYKLKPYERYTESHIKCGLLPRISCRSFCCSV